MKNAKQGATWGGRRARAVGALMSVGLAFSGSIATAGTASADAPTSITVSVDTSLTSTGIKTKAGGIVTTLRFGSTWS